MLAPAGAFGISDNPHMSDLVEKLPRIPDIMKKRGWNTAARLMKKWFDGPANDNRDKQPADKRCKDGLGAQLSSSGESVHATGKRPCLDESCRAR